MNDENDEEYENNEYDSEENNDYSVEIQNFTGPHKQRRRKISLWGAVLRTGQALTQLGDGIEEAGISIQNTRRCNKKKRST